MFLSLTVTAGTPGGPTSQTRPAAPSWPIIIAPITLPDSTRRSMSLPKSRPGWTPWSERFWAWMISNFLPPIVPAEDFWSRQANTQQWSFDFAPFGIPAKITANQPEVLAAARLASGRYSQSPEPNGQPILLQL